MIVLSHIHAAPLLQARTTGSRVAHTSLDLGLTWADVALSSDGVQFTEAERLAWGVLETIAADKEHCYRVEAGTAGIIRGYSEITRRTYSLYPTDSAPTMVVAGFPMHRIKDTDPRRDTLAKIRAIAPVGGVVLDTCTGLGYTAIAAAETASQVVSVELDPVARAICRQNPWSRALFESPKISLRLGDCFDEIEALDADSFSIIIHDPPTLSLAGDLYSAEFYRHCLRVLKPRGRMFHYIGDPRSASGARTTRGVVRRLREAGFAGVKPAPAAFGVVAHR